MGFAAPHHPGQWLARTTWETLRVAGRDEQLAAQDWWTREMYARFGLAVYFCQTLELQLMNHLAVMRVGSELDLDGIDALLRQWFREGMGRHVRGVSNQLAVNKETAELLDAALALRNWLVHHYFRARTDRLGTVEGMQAMVEELDGYAEHLQAADAALTAETKTLMAKLGLPEETIGAVSEPFIVAVRAGQTPAGFAEWRALFDDREPPPPGT